MNKKGQEDFAGTLFIVMLISGMMIFIALLVVNKVQQSSYNKQLCIDNNYTNYETYITQSINNNVAVCYNEIVENNTINKDIGLIGGAR